MLKKLGTTIVVEDRTFSQVLQGKCVDKKVKYDLNNANSILQILLEKIEKQHENIVEQGKTIMFWTG